MFLERDAQYDCGKLEGLEDKKLVDELTRMLHDIDRITADAASDGLADYSSLQTLLGDTLDVKDLFKKWYDVFPPMEGAARQFIEHPTSGNREVFLRTYDSFFDVSKRNNIKFMQLCWNEYQKRLT